MTFKINLPAAAPITVAPNVLIDLYREAQTVLFKSEAAMLLRATVTLGRASVNQKTRRSSE